MRDLEADHRRHNEAIRRVKEQARGVHERAARLHLEAANLHQEHANHERLAGHFQSAGRADARADRERLLAENEASRASGDGLAETSE
jgi:hypothetical protein